LGLPRPAGGSLPSGLAGLLGPAAAYGGFGLPLRGTRRAAQPAALRAFLLPPQPPKIHCQRRTTKEKRPLSGLAMWSSAAQRQTKAVRPQGRAKSELQNVAPQLCCGGPKK